MPRTINFGHVCNLPELLKCNIKTGHHKPGDMWGGNYWSDREKDVWFEPVHLADPHEPDTRQPVINPFR